MESRESERPRGGGAAGDLDELERGVLELLLAGEHPVLAALRAQLGGCRAERRELTGCGFFTELRVDRTLPAAPTASETLRIGDVSAEMAGLDRGAGFLLFVDGGFLSLLEGYSYDEPWPDPAQHVELRYASGGPRDLQALRRSLEPDRPRPPGDDDPPREGP